MDMNPAAQPGGPAPDWQEGIFPLALVNAGIRLMWKTGLEPRPVLEAAALMARARRQTGLHDFGRIGHWGPLLEYLLDALGGAGLSPLGEMVAQGQITTALAARLRAHAITGKHDVGAVPITAPIIIVGHMRSGTTRLQRLLAADPRLDHTRLYESWFPVPAQQPPLIDGRRARVTGWLAGLRAINPGFAAIHPTAAAAADEEVGLLGVTMCSSQYEVQWRIPAYARICEAIDREPVYAEFKALLQITRWLRGGDHVAADRPWVLKVPQFTQDLAALLAVFPDARLLCLDRHSADVLASSVSLVHNQMAMQSDRVDARWIGGEWLRKLRLREQAMRTALALNNAPRLTIEYDAVNRDWQAEMRRVYAFIGLDFTRPVAARMAQFIARSQHRRRHRYDATAFGHRPGPAPDSSSDPVNARRGA